METKEKQLWALTAEVGQSRKVLVSYGHDTMQEIITDIIYHLAEKGSIKSNQLGFLKYHPDQEEEVIKDYISLQEYQKQNSVPQKAVPSATLQKMMQMPSPLENVETQKQHFHSLNL
ncbi:hypothetical protein FACS189452_08900 [Bacteroidia bacterium]|nr:hypothetical protein FACS189452_08900 [Bacteroidia bacterium]GHT81348.1 hypothetical protein FACS189467_5270 [Bacteroidia bacterium]